MFAQAICDIICVDGFVIRSHKALPGCAGMWLRDRASVLVM
jgi:hypothetical protein